jgi:hypothetical protein
MFAGFMSFVFFLSIFFQVCAAAAYKLLTEG